MPNNVIDRVWKRGKLIQIDDLKGIVCQAEAEGHIFRVSGRDADGTDIPLSGTVSAVFLRPDMTDVTIVGSMSDGVASVTLPEECYDLPGRFGLTVFVSEGNVQTAIYAAVGTIIRTSTGTVAPESTGDVVDLINRVNAAIAAIPTDWAGMMADIAPTYSSSAVYPVGSYVYYDGDLYRCTTVITSAENWNSAHWTAAVIGNDLSDLNSALNIMNQQLSVSFTASGVRTWNLADTGMVAGQKYYLQIASYSGANTLTRVTVRFYDSNTTLIEMVGDNLTVGSVINFVVPANAAKFRLLYYISASESVSARLTVNIWEYRFQSILDDLTSGLAAKVEGQTFGYIYSGNININRTNNTITSTGLRVITSRGIYNSISDVSISFDSSSLLFVGYSASDSSHALTTYQLDFATSSDKVLLFAYQNGRLYFTDQYDKITINGGKYNPINNSRVICCLGDSFTAGGNSWPNQLNKQTNCVVANLGVAGTRMTVTYTSGSTEYKCFIDRVADGDLDSYTPDLIVVFGGINDAVKLHNNQCRIGEITDAAEYSASVTSGYSFIGRVKYLIDLVKAKKPGVPILGVLPPDYSEGTSDYEWWYDYIGQIRTALAEVYKYYGIPFVNLKTDCQEMYIDDYNLTTYRINGLSNMHPSVAGANAIGKIIYTRGVRDLFYMDTN